MIWILPMMMPYLLKRPEEAGEEEVLDDSEREQHLYELADAGTTPTWVPARTPDQAPWQAQKGPNSTGRNRYVANAI